MITINSLSKVYGDEILFENFSTAINRSERIGLIGPNGSGKTTLFSIILGKIEPSSGQVQINKGVRIGYLAQEASFTLQRTVLEEVVEGDSAIISLKKEKEELERANQAATARYGDILHELDFLGFYDLEYRSKKILMGLGFKEFEFDKPIVQMSGGWQMRVLLAKLLACRYDILLLDEPTNFLDLGAVLWFKDFLADFKGTFILISHDKDFLEEVTNYTLVVEHGTITRVRGSYEDYRTTQNQKRSHLLKQFTEQQKKKEQLEIFISRFHAQPNKAAQVRAKRRFLEKMDAISVPEDRRESIRTFSFPQTQRSGYRAIALYSISKSYGDMQVYKDFDFEITRGEKAVLVGENGAGKSTLLKILAGVIDIDKGKRLLGQNTEIGYFSQTRMDVLNLERTVLDEAYSAAKGNLTPEAVRTILGLFLFSGNDVDKKVKVLSGGEKSRLILAKLLINPPNFLLLDEPTTHLDIDAVDALIKALEEYDGSIVFISHDIHFVRSVAASVFEVKAGRVRKFPGKFDYYLQKKSSYGDSSDAASSDSNKSAVSVSKKEKKEQKKKEQKQKEQTQVNIHTPGEEEIKACNEELAKKIRKLRQRKETLEIKSYANKRILSSVHHNHDIKRKHKEQLEEIEEKISDIDKKINQLKSRFL